MIDGILLRRAESEDAWAMGVIETESKNLHAIRTTADSHRFTAEWGPVAAAEVPGRIKQLLERKHERLMNIFAEWDTDGNGIVSRGEFCAALRRLGLDLSDGDLVWLFECFDEDGGGSIDAAEFAHLVHSAASSRALSSLQARTLKQQGYRPTEAQMAKLRLLQSAAARGLWRCRGFGGGGRSPGRAARPFAGRTRAATPRGERPWWAPRTPPRRSPPWLVPRAARLAQADAQTTRELIAANTTLRVLKLDCSQMKDADAPQFVEALKANTTLKEFTAFQNEVRDRELRKAVKHVVRP